VTVGVSFQQNLSLLVHARPKLCVIFDYNPGVTEILVPFMGQLIAESPTRRDFLSRLLGVDLTTEETTHLLEGSEPIRTILENVLNRTNNNMRNGRVRRLRDLLRDKYLSRLPAQATPYIRSQALKWIDMLENEELLTGAFLADAVAPYQLSTVPAERKKLAGWLSTEENYALVRSYWTTGRIIGVTGDISGPSVAKLGAYLRNLHLQVTTLYLTHPSGLGHDMGAGHPERPDRLRAIAKVLSDGAFVDLLREQAPAGAAAAITRVHPEDYFHAIEAAAPTQGIAQLDPDTAMSPGTTESGLPDLSVTTSPCTLQGIPPML